MLLMIVVVVVVTMTKTTMTMTRISHHHHHHQVIILFQCNLPFPSLLARPQPLSPTQKQAFQLLWDYLDRIVDQNRMLVNCQ